MSYYNLYCDIDMATKESTLEDKGPQFGKTYQRLPRGSEYHKVRVVQCEIEMSDELYEAITLGFLEIEGNGGSIQGFINDRFKERMYQILKDPLEFGKLVLPDFCRVHMMQNDCEFSGDCD